MAYWVDENGERIDWTAVPDEDLARALGSAGIGGLKDDDGSAVEVPAEMLEWFDAVAAENELAAMDLDDMVLRTGHQLAEPGSFGIEVPPVSDWDKFMEELGEEET